MARRAHAEVTVYFIASRGVRSAFGVANGHPRYASAHDLRRAFGFRWSTRVMPPVLRELMRHESIDTTMQFYVGRNAEATAETVWSSFAKQPAKPTESAADASASEKP